MLVSEARKRLASLIAQVDDDQQAVELVSSTGSAYLVPAAQWYAMLETSYLLRSPANAQRLLTGIADAEAGRLVFHDLDGLAERDTDGADSPDASERGGADAPRQR